jgi:WD40 repeat protein
MAHKLLEPESDIARVTQRQRDLWRPICMALLASIAMLRVAPAQPISDHPLLRIETGTHTAKIHDAAADTAGRLLVTVSNDKTARIWSLPELRPLGVLRPPIGVDHEGELYAVAISPDGRTAAVGGFTGRGGNDDLSIYFFDLTTRAVVRRLAGLPAVVESLAFAPDGRLAAGLGSSSGIRIWRGDTLQFEDHEYRGSVYGVSFAPDGRLAAVDFSGSLRLYSANGSRLKTVETQAGKRPVRVKFNRVGTLLGIGFDDRVAAEVRDGSTLALRPVQPDVAGLSDSAMAMVGWISDSDIFLAGSVWTGSSRDVLAWPANGSGARRTAAAAFGDFLGGLVPLPGGSLALASRSAEIAVTAPDGTRLRERLPVGGDLITSSDVASPSWRLRLSNEGKQVEWVTYRAQQRLLRYDAGTLALSVAEAEATGLSNWTDSDEGLHVTDWPYDRPDLRFNGHTLKLDDGEDHYSASVAHRRLLLGGLWSLRLFDAKGAQTWSRSLPAVAWRVNQSPDGRLMVAALGDSTIRWFRASDGVELLALMVTEDAARWIAFMPSGYYAAGPKAEDLIGWHVNRGPDQAADFFPASRFRDQFYRPDVVQRILDTQDEAEAVRLADAARGPTASRPSPAAGKLFATLLRDRPPVVTILSPTEGTTLPDSRAELQVEIRSPTGRAITKVEARIGGRPVVDAQIGAPAAVDAPGGERAQRQLIAVPLPSGQETAVQILAWTDDRSSEAAVIHLRAPAAPQPPPASIDLPRLNAVLVGISAYQHDELKLHFAAKDARDLAEALRRQKGGLYREANIHLVPEAEANRDRILGEILWLRRETVQRDLAILFLAGHGVSEDVEYYFLTVDSDPDAPSIRGLPGTQLRNQLRQIPGRTLAFLDTCYAGALVQGQRTRDLPLDISKLVAELSAPETGVAVYSATTNRQRAQELDTLQNGVFTAALIEVLSGRYGPSGAGPIRVNYLATLLAERVKTLTGGRQASAFNALDPIRDVPLFVVR